jgi:DNA (cytosine-5)-methyltransferase 1
MKKSKKINYLDLFAGCGGLTDGFEQTGLYNALACIEWDKSACETLSKRLSERWGYNKAKDFVLRFDIQRTEEVINGWNNDAEYNSAKGFNYYVGNNEVDIIIGGPPCQAYSIAGRIRDKHGMKNDYRNYLFQSYLKIVEQYKPKLFVFENVLGMLSAAPDGELIINKIREGFSSIGYELIEDIKDNAVFDGVPQNRTRVILVGINKNYFKEYNIQTILNDFYSNMLCSYKVNKIKTVKDAIYDLPKFEPLTENIKILGKKYSHFPTRTNFCNHTPRFHNQRDIEIFEILAKDVYYGYNKYSSTQALKNLYTQKTGKTSSVHKYNVLDWNKPSNTIVAHLYKDGLRHIHPDYKQARSITVREAARLQTFDDDFIFLGNQGDQYKMIGNAVPPLFAKVIALAVNEFLEKYQTDQY